MGTETRPGHWPEPLIGVGPVAVPIHLWIAPLAFRGLGVFALGDALVLPLVSWWDLDLRATDTTPAVSPEISTMPEESLHALGTRGTGGVGPEGRVTGPTLAMYQTKPRVLPCANEALEVATLAAATPTKEICCAYAAAGRRTHTAAGSAFFPRVCARLLPGREGWPAMSNAADAVLRSLADDLWQAEFTRSPIPPITDRHPDLTVEDAYAIQTYNIDRRVAAAGVVRGRRLGMTSQASRDLYGVLEPNFGVLMADMFLDDGDEIRFDTLLSPRIEAEFAFVMATDLCGPGVSTVDALLAIGGVLPAIGVVDSRIADWRIRIQDTVADNGSAAHVVLGSRIFPVISLDLCHLGVLFFRNGSPIDSAAGAAVLGNPARCVAWLANKLGALGSGLHAGDTVLSGALHRMVPVRPGDSFRAQFAHIGSVNVQFTRTPV